VIGSTLNKYKVPLPVKIDENLIKEGSFIELLFANDFPYPTYEYRYKEIEIDFWPSSIRQRIAIYPSTTLVELAPDGSNILDLQVEDFRMLDVLLRYRQDSTSVQIYDTTGNIIITDTTSLVTISGDPDTLSTPLSKLIFLYLDLHINSNLDSYFRLPAIVSDCSLIATAFELKLIEDYFRILRQRSSEFSIYCSP